MKNIAYILIASILLCAPVFAGSTDVEDTLDTSKKGQAVETSSHGSSEKDDSGTNLGTLIESLFRGAMQADEAPKASSRSSRTAVSESEDRLEMAAPTVAKQSAPAPTPTPAAKSVSSSKGRDVFIDENDNGIDDSREKSSTSSTSRSK